MTFTFEVLVTLKEGLADPAGKAVEAALPTMGWTNVDGVHVGKHVKLTVEETDEATARAQVDQIAQSLLSNPVIEDYWILDQRGV